MKLNSSAVKDRQAANPDVHQAATSKCLMFICWKMEIDDLSEYVATDVLLSDLSNNPSAPLSDEIIGCLAVLLLSAERVSDAVKLEQLHFSA